MSRTANPDIGQITCPFTGELAAVRRYRTGQRLAYFHSKAGKIAPNLPAGQKYILDNATFNDPEDRRQIASWLESRGIQDKPEMVPEPEPEFSEVVIGSDSENNPEPVPGIDPIDPETSQEEKSIFSWFNEDDEDE